MITFRSSVLLLLALSISGCAELRALGDSPRRSTSTAGDVFQAPLISGGSGADVPVAVFQVEKPVASPSLVEKPVISVDPARQSGSLDPKDAVRTALEASTQSSDARMFDRAKHNFLYFDNSVYEVYFSPGFLTTLYLQPDEELINLFAGDTARWSITQTHTGSDDEQQTLVLVKPHIPEIQTNFVISTNKRVYLINAIATDQSVYHTAVAWNYPSDNLNSLRPVLSGSRRQPQSAAQVSRAREPSQFAYDYQITLLEGDAPKWQPVSVFNDGLKTYIRFPNNLGAVDAPPLFIIGAEEETGLVNYRVDGNFYVVDRLIDQAVLQHGDPRSVVSITRVGG